MVYINADEIQQALGCENIEAAKIAEKRREGCVREHQSFCFETVLSTDSGNLNLLKQAKQDGFFIRCYYVLTADAPNQCGPCGLPGVRRRSWCSS